MPYIYIYIVCMYAYYHDTEHIHVGFNMFGSLNGAHPVSASWPLSSQGGKAPGSHTIGWEQWSLLHVEILKSTVLWLI